MKIHLKKYRPLVIFIILVFIFLLLIIIMRQSPSTPPPPPPPLSNRTTDPKTLRFQFSPELNLNFPTTLKTYQASQTRTNLAPALAQQLQLNPSPHSPNVWYNENKTIAIIQDQFANDIQISWVPSREIINVGINPQQIYQVVAELLNQLGLNDIQPNFDLAIYATEVPEEFNSPESIVSKEPSQATYAFVPLYQTINNFPIYQSNTEPLRNHLIIDNNYQVLNMLVYPPLTNFQETGESATKNASLLMQDLNTQSFIVVDAVSKNRNPFPTITGELLIYRALIEYRHDPETGNVYPYIRFDGSSPEFTRVSILIPAI